MKGVIQPKRKIRWYGYEESTDQRPFEGTIIEESFQIQRIIEYRNSFLPKIIGSIHKESNGAIIKIKMRPHIFVLVFCALWFIGASIGCIAALTINNQNEDFQLTTFMPFAMVLFFYLLVMGGFKYESKKTKIFFSQMFDNE